MNKKIKKKDIILFGIKYNMNQWHHLKEKKYLKLYPSINIIFCYFFYILLFLIEFYYALIFYLQNLVNDNNSKGEEDLRIFFGDGIFILDLLFFIIFIFRYFLELFLTFIELIILFLLDIFFYHYFSFWLYP